MNNIPGLWKTKPYNNIAVWMDLRLKLKDSFTHKYRRDGSILIDARKQRNSEVLAKVSRLCSADNNYCKRKINHSIYNTSRKNISESRANSTLNRKANKSETPETVLEVILSMLDLFLSMDAASAYMNQNTPKWGSFEVPPSQVFQRSLTNRCYPVKQKTIYSKLP